MNPEWCAACRGDDDRSVSPPAQNRNVFGDGKQAQLDRLCHQLSIPTVTARAGSTLPPEVFAAAAQACGVSVGTLPETSALIATKAGLKWTPSCATRATATSGGSTVTREGLVVLNRAVAVLLARA